MYALMTVTLPNRPALRMLAPDSDALRQAVAAGELVMLDQQVRERSGDGAHDGGSAMDGTRHTR